MPRSSTTICLRNGRTMSPSCSGSPKWQRRKRSGRKRPITSSGRAQPRQTIRRPGLRSSICMGCVRTGRLQRRRRPSWPKNSRPIPMFSTPRAGFRSHPATPKERLPPTNSVHELAPNSAPALSRYLGLLNAAKDYTQARTVLQAAIARDPKNGALKGDLIRAEAEIGGLEAGLAKARDFRQGRAGKPALRHRLGRTLWRRPGARARRVGSARKGRRLRGQRMHDLNTALARLYSRSGDPAKAEAVLTSRLQVDPKDVSDPLGSGLALSRGKEIRRGHCRI